MPKNEKPSGWNFACAAISTCASALLFSTHAGVAGAAVAACGAGACADAATGRVNARAMARTSGFMVSVPWKADATLRRAPRAGNAPQGTRVRVSMVRPARPTWPDFDTVRTACIRLTVAEIGKARVRDRGG